MKIWKKGSALLLCALPVVALVASCDLIVHTDPKGCETDADCVNFPNTGCDAEQGLCVSLDTCSSNADCGEDSVCRPVQPRSCQPVKQGNCNEVYPNDDTFRNDRAILIGVSSPASVDISTGLSIVNGAKLGVDQFNKDGGIGGDQPMVLIICDDHADTEDAYDNGVTLSTIGAEIMIGPAYSGQTLETAGTPDKPGTVANNMVLFSSSATSPLVTGIADKSPRCQTACGDDADCVAACPGLVWRTSPSDEYQGAAIAKYVAEIESDIRTRNASDPTMPVETRTDITAYVLYKPDAYGDLLSDIIRTKLVINGAPATTQQNSKFYRVDYEDTDTETDGIQPNFDVVDEAIAKQPDVVFLIGTDEVAEILTRIEMNWTGAEEDRPYYILGDGGLSSAVANAARQVGALERVRGTVPGPPLNVSDDYLAFAGAYNAAFPTGADDGPEIFGAAGAFDIVFLIAYSSIVANGAPLTAEQLARGFSSLADVEKGVVIHAGKPDIGKAKNALANGKTINYEGASGPLDFDLSTGEAPSAIQVWCVKPAADSLPVLSNHYWQAGDAPNDPGQMLGSAEPAPDAFVCPFPD